MAVEFRSELVAAIKANTTIQGIVAARVFPCKIPETQSPPALSFSVTNLDRQHNLDGPNGVAVARVAFQCKSKSYVDCDAIKEALRNLFDGSSYPVGQVQVQAVRSENEKDTYIEPPDDSDQGTYEITFELLYRYREVKPTLT